MRYKPAFAAALLMSVGAADAEQPDDIAGRLDVCRGMRAIFINDSETLQVSLRHSSATIADLQKKLAEAEAKVPPYPIDPNTLSE